MSSQPRRDHPSPLLTADRVREILIDSNGEAGAAGGAVGGAIGGSAVGGALGGAAGARGGSSGGRTGGRLGARMFTRVLGQTRTVPVPRSPEALEAVRRLLRQELPSAEDAAVIGLMGTGWLNMNTAVVQLVWLRDRVEVTAHALEGLVNQRSVPKALDAVERALRAVDR
ncbi:hypothetical protein [Aeromicrobium piscarium]|uniref:Uncharacterized protein n=1 Tax=Aeromicrobium piscarium TaxID=2590901 RepID=A0A554S6S4_9ACTN|nr:hypothetical protein [Aeromicrobium piscarium]TSD62057.1 hypothetical protein FNM00_13135 [Aeromicrobium piscarium]